MASFSSVVDNPCVFGRSEGYRSCICVPRQPLISIRVAVTLIWQQVHDASRACSVALVSLDSGARQA
jgi:hypothetical protein